MCGQCAAMAKHAVRQLSERAVLSPRRCWFLPRIAAVTVDGADSETPSGSFSRLSDVIIAGKLAPCRHSRTYFVDEP